MIVTKKMFCEAIVKGYLSSNANHNNIDDINNIIRKKELPNDVVYKNNSLGIAMEYLDLLTNDQAREYIKDKSGDGIIFYEGNGKWGNITLRDIIESLPDSIVSNMEDDLK